eukprot:scaffold79992_cov31-Phaeocystis_antarctica.AAC.1
MKQGPGPHTVAYAVRGGHYPLRARTLAALSLTPVHSLRHRLVRSRQSASYEYREAGCAARRHVSYTGKDD